MPAKKKSPPKLLSDTQYDFTRGDKERARQEKEVGMLAPWDPLLIQKAKPVAVDDIHTQHVKDVIDRLYMAAEGQRKHSHQGKRRRTLVGLAAPQIGEPVRIVLIDTKVDPGRKHYGELICFINPQIVWRSHEKLEGREGCFSAGPVWGLVRRSIAVKVRAYNRDGKIIEHILEDFTARIAQHEIDHLDGIRFADRIRSDKKRHWVHAEELDEYPKHIKHWRRLCSKERWEALKTAPPA